MNEKRKDNYNLTVKLSTVTAAMVICGLAFFVVPIILEKKFSISNIVLIIIIEIFKILGTSLFSAGLVSVIVEISTIRNLVAKAFKNILSGSFYLDGLSKDALVNLKNDIALKLLGLNGKNLSNSPYKYENMLLNLVNEKYYDHHNIVYHITPDEKKNCFHIRVKLDYEIVNKNLIDNFFEYRLKLYNIKSNMGNIGNNFSATVEINNNEVDINSILSTEAVTHDSESTYYDSKIRLYKQLDGTRNKIKAKIVFDVPMFDICQSFKISVPCKNIDHRFFINNDISTGEKWMIHANAYSTFYHRQDEENSNYKVEQNVDDSLIIRYKDWALVGNGYCVFYQKKQ